MPIPGSPLATLVVALRAAYRMRDHPAAHPLIGQLISHAEGLAAALEDFAESPIRCADKQCHREMCGPEECGRCSRAINAWRALRGVDS